MRLLWLPTVLRGAGLTVHEVAGWKTRGDSSFGPVRGITIHHTAGSRNSSDSGEIRVLLNGSQTAPPPIAQLYLSRTGHWHVIASGLCFHNKVGWGGPNEGYGNDNLLGIEAQHSGGDEPWTTVQYGSYVRGVAALVRHKASGYSVTVSRVAGHKEHQPGNKTDPTFSMTKFRADVAREIKEGDDVTPQELQAAVKTGVKDALDDAMPWVSAGVKAAAKATDPPWGDTVSARALLEYLFGEAVLKGRTNHALLLTAIQGVDEEVAAKLGAGELTAERIAEILRPLLGDKAAEVGRILVG